MLKKVITVLKEHRAGVESAERTFAEREKYINNNYAGTRKASELGEAKEVYNNSMQEVLKKSDESINAIFEEVAKKVTEVTTQPVEAGFTDTLEALRVLKKPTRAELEALAGRYNHNYFCYRAICDVLGGNAKGYSFITFDELLAKLENLKGKVKHAVRCDINLYTFRVLEAGHEVERLNKVVNAFVECRFDEARNADQDEE